MSTITMTDVDPGEGSPLQADNFLAVYGGTSLLNIFYPVGTSYKTYDTTFDPNVTWGGVWTEDTDYTLVAYVYTSGNSGTTIATSKNIASVTKIATGQYQISFSKTMEDADYVVSLNSEASGTGFEIGGVYEKSTTQFMIDFAKYDGTVVDQSQINILVFGRLAIPEYKIWKRTA